MNALSFSPIAVVVVGHGQVMTAITLRSLGWRVELAATLPDGRRMARDIDASLLVVRVRAADRDRLAKGSTSIASVSFSTMLAVVDEDDTAATPEGFDAAVDVNAADDLARFVSSIAPTMDAIEVCETVEASVVAA